MYKYIYIVFNNILKYVLYIFYFFFLQFTNIIVLTLAKDPSLYNEWVNIYKQYQYQPKNIHLTKTIIKNIQDQQAQYLEKGEQLPTENRWRAVNILFYLYYFFSFFFFIFIIILIIIPLLFKFLIFILI